MSEPKFIDFSLGGYFVKMGLLVLTLCVFFRERAPGYEVSCEL